MEATPAPATPVAAPVVAEVQPAPAQTTTTTEADDLDGQPSWRTQVVEKSFLAEAMLAEQLAYEERFGFTGMEPLARPQVEVEGSE